MPFDYTTGRWAFATKPAKPAPVSREPIVALGWTQQQWDKVWDWYEQMMGVRPAYRNDSTYKAVNYEWQRRKGSLQP